MPTGRKKGNQKRTGRPIITNKGNNSQYNDFVSASKISQTQFLLLRTLIITRETDDFEPEAYQLEEKIAEAKELLERNRGFKAYLNAIKKDTGSGSSHFSEVRKHQLEVLWGRKDGGMLEKIDETPVNSSFIIFLRALESLVPDCKYWWRWSKHSFSVNFSKTKPKKGQKRRGYTAITDGQLQEYKSHEIKALIECKMDTRKSCKPAVDMQEAAQMVAWIKQYPSEERRRVTVAQDGKEMYIIISEYTDGYLAYITDNKPTNDFMAMTQYGPYAIDNAADVNEFAYIVLSFLL